MINNDLRQLKIVNEFRISFFFVLVGKFRFFFFISGLQGQILVTVLSVGGQPSDVVRLLVAAPRLRAPRPVTFLTHFLAALGFDQTFTAGVSLLAALKKKITLNTHTLCYMSMVVWDWCFLIVSRCAIREELTSSNVVIYWFLDAKLKRHVIK